VSDKSADGYDDDILDAHSMQQKLVEGAEAMYQVVGEDPTTFAALDSLLRGATTEALIGIKLELEKMNRWLERIIQDSYRH
jgi:hypothetical protein